MLREIIFDAVLVIVGSMIVLFLIFLFVALSALAWHVFSQRRKRDGRNEEGAPRSPITPS